MTRVSFPSIILVTKEDAMTNQAKNLRAILKKNGIKARVRTQRSRFTHQGERFSEWGRAISHLGHGIDITPGLVESLRNDNCRVYYSEEHATTKGHNFAIVEW